MKKINFVFGLIILICIVFILGKQLFSSNGNFTTSASNDPKILTVQEFWQQSLKKDDVEKSIIPVPKDFYDDSPRCSTSNKNEKEQVIDITQQTKEDGFTRGLRNTAFEIGKGQFLMLKSEIYRYWENEAIVEVDFAKTDNHKITEKRFFFLILIDGKWKIFMDTSVPDLMNKEYANFDCSK